MFAECAARAGPPTHRDEAAMNGAQHVCSSAAIREKKMSGPPAYHDEAPVELLSVNAGGRAWWDSPLSDQEL